jgi:hypothetical protein
VKLSHVKTVLALLPLILLNSAASGQGQPPVPLFPVEGAFVDSSAVWLEWEEVPGAVEYEVQMGTTCEEGASYVVPQARFLFAGMQVDLDYFWRVRARLEPEGWGDYCPCAWFMTGLLGPGVPQNPRMGY